MFVHYIQKRGLFSEMRKVIQKVLRVLNREKITWYFPYLLLSRLICSYPHYMDWSRPSKFSNFLICFYPHNGLKQPLKACIYPYLLLYFLICSYPRYLLLSTLYGLKRHLQACIFVFMIHYRIFFDLSFLIWLDPSISAIYFTEFFRDMWFVFYFLPLSYKFWDFARIYFFAESKFFIQTSFNYPFVSGIIKHLFGICSLRVAGYGNTYHKMISFRWFYWRKFRIQEF